MESAQLLVQGSANPGPRTTSGLLPVFVRQSVTGARSFVVSAVAALGVSGQSRAVAVETAPLQSLRSGLVQKMFAAPALHYGKKKSHPTYFWKKNLEISSSVIIDTGNPSSAHQVPQSTLSSGVQTGFQAIGPYNTDCLGDVSVGK